MKNLVKGALFHSPLPEMMLHYAAPRRLTVLSYHRISEPIGCDYPFDEQLVSATPEEFRRELLYMKRHFDVMSIKDLVRGLKERSLPKRPAIVTFDDGYADNHDVALPLLTEAGLTACFFLSTGLVGTRNIPWWDQVSCCFKHSAVTKIVSPFGEAEPSFSCEPKKSLSEINRFHRTMKGAMWPQALEYLEDLKVQTKVDPSEYALKNLFMSWDQARTLVSRGMEAGGHSRTHPALGNVTDEKMARDEIIGGYRDLVRELGIDPLAFSYPEGSEQAMSAVCDRIIAEAGFAMSFSCLRYLAPRQPANPWRLPRLHAEFGDNFNEFRLALARAVATGVGGLVFAACTDLGAWVF